MEHKNAEMTAVSCGTTVSDECMDNLKDCYNKYPGAEERLCTANEQYSAFRK